MAKSKLIYGLPLAALMCGVGIFAPGAVENAAAYTVDADGYAVPTGDTDEALYKDLKQAIADKYNVKLDNDINHYVAISNEPSIEISHSMTLDLNGHILSTASTNGGANGNNSITATGEDTVLTIKDSSESQSGAIRYDHRDNASPDTIRILSGAKVILESGSVYSPYGKSGGGLAVNIKGNGAAFEMTGGKVLSHEDSKNKQNCGVKINASGTSVKLTGGEVSAYGSAVFTASESKVDITGVSLSSVIGQAVEASSMKVSGSISGIEAKSLLIYGNFELKDITLSVGLALGPGEKTLTNMTVTGPTTISGGVNKISNSTFNGALTTTAGTNTLGEGVTVNGLVNVNGGTNTVDGGAVLTDKLTYTSTAGASLTINDGAKIAGFNQVGKTTSASYKDAETKESYAVSYNTYGNLLINGGEFSGEFVTATEEQVVEANAIRKEYVEAYNEHSGKTMEYSDVAHMPLILGGQFAAEPEAEAVVEGMEAEKEGDVYVILPKQIDMVQNGEMASDGTKSGAIAGSATFTSEFVTDRKAYFELATLDDDKTAALTLDETKGGDLVLAFDAALHYRDDAVIENVNGTEIAIKVALTEEQYNALKAYDGIAVVYFDDENKEAEQRLPATIVAEVEATTGETEYYLTFATTHLSTYGVVGVTNVAADETTAEATAEAGTPETGTMTAAGASAASAGVVTAAAVAVIAVIAGLAAIIRRK